MKILLLSATLGLAAALHAYGRQAGVQLFYDSRSAAGRQSVAVQGRLVPDEARAAQGD